MNKEQIRTMVQEELKKQIMNPKETVVTEGVIRRVLHSLGGAIAGVPVGLLGGVGISEMLFSAGVIAFISPVALAIVLGAAGFAALAGAIAGRRSAMHVDRRHIETAIQNLVDVINERDEVIRELDINVSNETMVSALERRFDQLTREQINVATELERLMFDEDKMPEWDSTLPNVNFIRKQYDVITKEILPKAVYGKATFIDEKEVSISSRNRR
jgi:hypothetical protein